MCLQDRAGQSRPLVEIVNVRKADKFIDVLESGLVLSQQNDVVCPVFLDIQGAVFKPRVFIRIQIAFDTLYYLDIFA